MKAIEDIRRYLNDHAGTPGAEVLARLPATLQKEETLSLSHLYLLDWDSFELAIELMRDWRIDRYYAERIDYSDDRAKEKAAEDIRHEDVADDSLVAAE